MANAENANPNSSVPKGSDPDPEPVASKAHSGKNGTVECRNVKCFQKENGEDNNSNKKEWLSSFTELHT